MGWRSVWSLWSRMAVKSKRNVNADYVFFFCSYGIVIEVVMKPKVPPLPCNSCKESLRPLPDAVFPGLVNHQPAEAECSRQEPVLHWHLAGANRALYTRNVTENKDNDDRKHHSREQKPILCLLVEQRWLLEDRQASCTRGQQVEYLHDNQCDEVDTTGGVDLLVDIVGGKRRLVCAVLQPHGSEGHALLFKPPE